MKSYISCSSIIALKVITVISSGSHLNDRSGFLIEKIHGCLFEYGRLNGNESLFKDLWNITKQNNSQILTTEVHNVGVPGNSCFCLPYD